MGLVRILGMLDMVGILDMLGILCLTCNQNPANFLLYRVGRENPQGGGVFILASLTSESAVSE